MVAKYLIIRFGSVREVLFTTPAIRCLKQQVNGAEIHYLVDPLSEPILKANPYITKIHVHQGDFATLIHRLKQEQYDYILDFQKNRTTWRIKSRLRLLSFDVDTDKRKKGFLRNRNSDPDNLFALHPVDRYMQCLRVFDVHNDQQGPDYFIPQDEKVSVDQLPKSFRNGFIALIIDSESGTGQVPVEKAIQLCKAIERPVLIIGSEKMASAGECISEQIEACNSCGKFNLNQMAFLMQQAELVITCDNEFMHIAAAFQKSMISL